MDSASILAALDLLNRNNPCDCDGDILELLAANIHRTCEEFNLGKPSQNLPEFAKFHDDSPLCKYLTLNFHYLLKLPPATLSIQQTKSLRDNLKQLTTLGINFNLLENSQLFVKCASDSFHNESELVLRKYNRLGLCVYGLLECLRNDCLKYLIVANYLQALLNALYQIIYCPLKKPNKVSGEFEMSEDLYGKLLRDKEVFKLKLEELSRSVNKGVYIKETMILLEGKTALWFKKAVSLNLTKLLKERNGFENIVVALLENSADYDPNDITKTWKTVDVIVKLVLSLRKSEDFKSNICEQINSLVFGKAEVRFLKVFELIYVAIVKVLYNEERVLCGDCFLSALLSPLTNLANGCVDERITGVGRRTIRLVHSAFVCNNAGYPDLPLSILTPVINIIFRLHAKTVTSNLGELNTHLKEILMRYLKELETDRVFDSFLFNIPSEILTVKYDVRFDTTNDQFEITQNKPEQQTNDLINLLKNNKNSLTNFFVYLLKTLNSKDKYYPKTFEETIERELFTYNLLSILAENKQIQSYLNDNPKEIIEYFHNVLIDSLNSNLNSSTEDFQTMFVVIMLLQALIANSKQESMVAYKKLLDPLKAILTQVVDEELRKLIIDVVKLLEKGSFGGQGGLKEDLSEVDLAIEEVCDALLPVRGHGLMALAKLIENRNEEALERKMYILNVFRQNIKNDDSYIYLNAIKGLATLGEVFPDIVLETLTEEYLDYNKRDTEDGKELRMKIGEILVRIVRNLGDEAPKYKSLLLNTFLVGSKDDDHLIRASSLSNLGEICRVLGYKVGPIITEILACVGEVIGRDKAVEARRAAVTVWRQLFVGVECEMLRVFQDDILEIYRTLKNLYLNDPDDVTRLQAQLALEELNDNVKKLLNIPRTVQADSKQDMLK